MPDIDPCPACGHDLHRSKKCTNPETPGPGENVGCPCAHPGVEWAAGEQV